MPKDRFLAKRVSYEWRIENFLDREFSNNMLESPKFLLSDTHLSIRIFPKGIGVEWAELVLIYLFREISQNEHRVKYTLGLKCEDGLVVESLQLSHSFGGRNYSKPIYIRRSRLTSTEENILGPGGTLTVFCEACEADDSSVEAETLLSDSFQTFSDDFEKFYLKGSYTDVVLDVRGEKFSAHRFVLASRSSVFQSMFEADMKEKQTGVVNISDCDPEVFKAFLLFMYNGKIDVVTSDNALGLYTAADKYNVQILKKLCSQYLARHLNIDLASDVILLATLHEEQELLNIATTYFIKNASKILRTSQWQILSRVNPSLANELFIKMADSLTV